MIEKDQDFEKEENQLNTKNMHLISNIIDNYAKTWTSLLEYDEDKLEIPHNLQVSSKLFDYDIAKKAINQLKNFLFENDDSGRLFGLEREKHLESILLTLEQTMFNEELYKSTEEKAANLLYMIIKDHPFSDGNKRIGSFLFLLYLKINQLPLMLDDNGMIALALLIAESNPFQKDLIVRLVINLIKQ
ncbi:MAG TPA: Fic family protein [Burkholderiales bacterium]|nr:Fic family protein [Burkholderiales bacterium]